MKILKRWLCGECREAEYKQRMDAYHESLHREREVRFRYECLVSRFIKASETKPYSEESTQAYHALREYVKPTPETP